MGVISFDSFCRASFINYYSPDFENNKTKKSIIFLLSHLQSIIPENDRQKKINNLPCHLRSIIPENN